MTPVLDHIRGYVLIPEKDNEEMLKLAVATYGPIATGMTVHKCFADYSGVLPENENIAYVTENNPNLLKFYLTHACALLPPDSKQVLIYFSTVVFQFLFYGVIYTLLTLILIMVLRKRKGQMSTKTYEMQRQLVASLIIQVI
uniref:Uncharacterized protein n=1 Tax=Ditylenchus dipsaci TaxID=166011 RepID=A0A915DR32_9BILA